MAVLLICERRHLLTELEHHRHVLPEVREEDLERR